MAALNPEQLKQLSDEIRSFLIEKVSKSGGHLGPNLGVVELTIAIHRVFESPKDIVLFDTGYQSYVHKILTGRAKSFDQLRQRGGISGYPNRAESPHDLIENSHASAALSWGDGISRGFALQGEVGRHVVVVVGDGALTGGMASQAYREGVGVTVIDLRWVKPLPTSLITMAERYKSVVEWSSSFKEEMQLQQDENAHRTPNR